MLRYVITLVAVFFIFMFGVTFGYYKYPPFSFLINVKHSLMDTRESLFIEDFLCELPVASNVPTGSHAFIGHGYGAPGKSNETDFLASDVLNFISRNKKKLKSVSFTGDVFAVPSREKWKRLSELTGSHNIFVAPGNHDIARPDSLDVFNLSPFGNKVPFLEQLDGFPVVYDDSVSSNWLVSNKTKELVNSSTSQSVIIARHNIPVSELWHLANSSDRTSKFLPDLNEFVRGFRADVRYTWLIGDSGAFLMLPRLSCIEYSNHTFIVNGIGEVLGDSVVLFKDGTFYKHEL